jgi:hypothetical protein
MGSRGFVQKARIGSTCGERYLNRLDVTQEKDRKILESINGSRMVRGSELNSAVIPFNIDLR